MEGKDKVWKGDEEGLINFFKIEEQND
jgi:hypothetical protein